jgi:hypothetical protein
VAIEASGVAKGTLSASEGRFRLIDPLLLTTARPSTFTGQRLLTNTNSSSFRAMIIGF